MAQYKEQGNAKYKAGKYEEAADAYGKAIEAEPNEATYYGNRAAALLMLKKYDEAHDDCKKAIELDPSFVKGYVRSVVMAYCSLCGDISTTS
jgi:DnaJ family protein C protein 7